jgi:hypothetical protein
MPPDGTAAPYGHVPAAGAGTNQQVVTAAPVVLQGAGNVPAPAEAMLAIERAESAIVAGLSVATTTASFATGPPRSFEELSIPGATAKAAELLTATRTPQAAGDAGPVPATLPSGERIVFSALEGIADAELLASAAVAALPPLGHPSGKLLSGALSLDLDSLKRAAEGVLAHLEVLAREIAAAPASWRLTLWLVVALAAAGGIELTRRHSKGLHPFQPAGGPKDAEQQWGPSPLSAFFPMEDEP